MKRALATLALGFFVALGMGGQAHAIEVGPKEGVSELDKSRALLDESYELAKDGDYDEAFTAARNAYLDHFELVEIPLRVRDEALTLALEEDYAELRSLLESRADVSDIRAQVVELTQGLDEVERTLTEPGIGAPAIAFTFSFITLFREGLEAVLVIAAILGFLAASRNERYRPAVLKGVGAAVLATVVIFVLVTTIIRIAPLQRELFEAGTTIAAVGVLFYISFWLFARLEQRRWMEFLNAKVFAAAATGSSLALASVGFTAVFREGLETTLFYQALLFFAQGLEIWVGLGAAAAAVVLLGIGFAIFRAGRKLPIRRFLATAVILIMTLSVAFMGNAVRGLQKATVIGVNLIEGAPRLPIFVAELLGYHPTTQTITAQALLAAVYVLGGIWFVVMKRRRTPATIEAPVDVQQDVPVE